MLVLGPEGWRPLREAHEARAAGLSAAHRARREARQSHAVDDFLWTYYSLRPGRLARWHPGAGVALTGTDDVPPGYRETATGSGTAVVADPAAFADRCPGVLEWVSAVLGGVASRPARHDCFGLHEWAMVYRADERRHALPLRLGPAGTDAVVESLPVRCSHIDAFRFFTEAAVPLNASVPTRAAQPDLDHAGCVHVTMDLLKWALKLGPLVPGDLLLDCFELARDARTLDMRASPYDVSGYGHEPVAVETPTGRQAYAAAQRDLAGRAAPLRQRLLAVCRQAVAEVAGAADAAEVAGPVQTVDGALRRG
ncbi:3-methyladenine DNA glycosylase [Aquipuribacter hungaricus]|uniref:3-methyladenine DNA glycosylase n=1 Tax=Aquipuribacter hungaricus TaxID=545624 RepID=A0ABV7WEN3_9MICO